MTDDELTDYVEEIAGLFARDGLPLITGRVIGWLMVCDPPEQTASQIGTAISASKASLSTNLRTLTESGFVRVVTRPGERSMSYRVDDDAWAQVTRRRLRALTSFRDVTDRGVRMLGEDSARSRRLRDARALFTWLDEELTPLWSRWDAERARLETEDSEDRP